MVQTHTLWGLGGSTPVHCGTWGALSMYIGALYPYALWGLGALSLCIGTLHYYALWGLGGPAPMHWGTWIQVAVGSAARRCFPAADRSSGEELTTGATGFLGFLQGSTEGNGGWSLSPRIGSFHPSHLDMPAVEAAAAAATWAS